MDNITFSKKKVFVFKQKQIQIQLFYYSTSFKHLIFYTNY